MSGDPAGTLPRYMKTPRLVLRPTVAADAKKILAAYTQDVELVRWMKWKAPTTLASTIAFVDECMADFAAGRRLPYVMAYIDEPETPIGMIEVKVNRHQVELAYVLSRAAWGRGLMPEAIEVVADTALTHPALFRVQAFCDVENTQSQRTLERAGFVQEGRHERYIVHPNVDPEPRACFMYAKCR